MKKQKIFLVLMCLAIFIIIGSIIFIKHEPASKKFELNTNEVNFIKIVYHGREHIITNKEKIKEVMGYFEDMQIREYSVYEKFKDETSIYGNKNYYRIDFCSDLEGKEVIYKNFYVFGYSDSDVLKINGIKYHIVSDNDISKRLLELTTYCKKPLPKLTEENVMKVNAAGYDKEITTEEALRLYDEILDAEPIKEFDFYMGNQYVVITTYDDEIITIYSVDNIKYIKYEKENIHQQQSDRKGIYFLFQ